MINVIYKCIIFLQILSKILSFLPYKNLKNTRLVNSFWFEESKPHFYQKGALSLYLVAQDPSFTQEGGYDSYKGCYKETKNIYLASQEAVSRQDFITDKLRQSIVAFTGLQSMSLKFLDFHYNMDTLDDCVFLGSILNNLPHLEELTMSFKMNKFMLELRNVPILIK
jgi:hypothetical protein